MRGRNDYFHPRVCVCSDVENARGLCIRAQVEEADSCRHYLTAMWRSPHPSADASLTSEQTSVHANMCETSILKKILQM